MDDQLIDRLCRLNSEFYRRTADSFSSTRHGSWPGWERLADRLEALLESNRTDAPCNMHSPSGGEETEPRPDSNQDRAGSPSDGNAAASASRAHTGELHVVDLAAGNLRFESFLESRLSPAKLRFSVVDDCSSFPTVQVQSPCSFTRADLIGVLRGADPRALDGIAPAQAAVSFGFAHHIPGKQLREALLAQMCRMLAPGGIAAVSFWNFAQDPKMRSRAEATTEQALARFSLPRLEEGDYILGWQNDPDAFRYCHSFTDEEVDDLASSLPSCAEAIDRYEADGRNGKLNTYLIFRKKE